MGPGGLTTNHRQGEVLIAVNINVSGWCVCVGGGGGGGPAPQSQRKVLERVGGWVDVFICWVEGGDITPPCHNVHLTNITIR